MGLKCSSENYQLGVKMSRIDCYSGSLQASMKDPKFVVYSDDLLVIIRDKYPKAQHHYLTLPKRDISCVKAINKGHLPLLKHMQEKAEEFCQRSESQQKFHLGYHAIPSMSHLHLHMISEDFDGPYMKTRSQWNSFTTEFLISPNKIIDELESSGEIKFMDTYEYLELLMQPLRCHICKMELATMLQLKEHIKACLEKSCRQIER